MRSKGKHTWYDWAVVHRMWNGGDPGREPTYPEIAELLARADRCGLTMEAFAELINKPLRTVTRWRAHLKALGDSENTGAVVIAAVA